MSAITRTYIFTDGTTAYGSQVDSEIQNIVTTWNNHDAGTSRWTVSDVTTTKKIGVTSMQILQSIILGSTNDFTTTSNAFQTTNCTNSITPNSTSSKIAIVCSGTLRNGAVQTASCYASLFRGSTNLGGGTNNAFVQISSASNTGNMQVPCTLFYLDSPASIASLTYSVKIANSDNATTIGFGGGNETFITLLELL